jgi:hypothetical protein
MRKAIILFLLLPFLACSEKDTNTLLTAQQVIDSSMAAAGGNYFDKSTISFDFRDIHYDYKRINHKKILSREMEKDSKRIKDVKTTDTFQRFVNDSLVSLSDSLANVYANSVNSVHYFAYLPQGLNDPAVNKKLLGKVQLDTATYYKIMVTFDQEGGGDDYDDTYIYWFNTKTFAPDYLAYVFHTNGGGQRFREAYNERFVNGIRFADYNNYRTKDLSIPITKIDSLFLNGELELLSKIELENVSVSRDSYN